MLFNTEVYDKSGSTFFAELDLYELKEELGTDGVIKIDLIFDHGVITLVPSNVITLDEDN